MAERSLGYITPGGSPDPLTANQADPTAAVWAHKYRVYPVPTNTGNGYVGDSTINAGTGDGVNGFIYTFAALGGGNPFYESPVVESGLSNPYDLSTVYLDADNPNDTFLVTYIEA